MSKSQIQKSLDHGNQPQNLKIKSSSGRETPEAVRKVRIIYTDPYATDDSDEDNNGEPNKPKRFIREINLPVDLKQPKGAESRKYQQKVSTKSLKALRPSSSLQKGIGRRKWGNQKKQQMGTSATSEAAAKAYDVKKLEIDANRSSNHSSPTALCLPHNHHAVPQSSTNVLTRELPSSILEGESSPINQGLNDTTEEVSIQTSQVAEQVSSILCEDEPLDLFRTEEYLDFEMELKCLFNDEPVHLPTDSCDVKDLPVSGHEDGPSTSLPDFNFSFDLSEEERAWMDEVSNMNWP